MKYSVKCNHCDNTFVAEADGYGRYKYRCPYCGKVLTCQFDEPTDFRVKASSVEPVGDSALMLSANEKLPVVDAKVIHPSVEALKSAGRQMTRVGAKSKSTITKILDHIEVFFGWSGSRISRFRQEYDDADLWLFFGFCVIFIVLVLLGLYIMAGFTKILAASHSALFKYWLAARNFVMGIF